MKPFELRQIREDLLVELSTEEVSVEIQLLQFRCVERRDEREMISIEFKCFQGGEDVLDGRREFREFVRREKEFLQVFQTCQCREIHVRQSIVLQGKVP